MKKFFVLFFITIQMLFAQAQLEEHFTFYNLAADSQEIILGYDPFGTDSLDPALGEEYIPQVPNGQFGVRCLMPTDTSITMLKDIRYGCGQPFTYNYLFNLSYNNNFPITVSWQDLGFYVYNMEIINTITNEVIETIDLTGGGSGEYTLPLINYVTLRLGYNGPLSWPSYQISYPNGGEILKADSELTVSYDYSLQVPLDNTKIEFTSDGGNNWIILADSINPYDTTFTVTLPDISSDNCLLRLGYYPCYYDVTNSNFIVYQAQPPAVIPYISTFTMDDGAGNIKTLTYGLHPDATSDLDTSLGEIPISPPPPGEFEATFYIDNHYRSRTDLQKGYVGLTGVKYSNLKVQPSASGIVELYINIPQGLNVELSYLKNVPGGIGFVDTLLTIGSQDYTFDPATRWDLNPQIIFHYNDITPVELVSFTAVFINPDVILKWQTATETNNKGFIVQRRQKGGEGSNNSWAIIGYVNGNGTTAEPKRYSFTDKNISEGNFQYRLRQIDFDGTSHYSAIPEVTVQFPDKFSLDQNYPNPFNPTTTISYYLPERSFVTLTIYDMLGREVVIIINNQEIKGSYKVKFDASYLASGVYAYQFKAVSSTGNFTSTKKMLLLK